MPKAVAVDYQSKVTKPTDFEAFWQEVWRQAEAIPLAPELVPDPLRTSDAIELAHTYPYQEINDYLRLHPDRRSMVEETLAYFDGINFADQITCPIIVNTGLQDNVCPPETGYALFNRIGAADKRLYTYDGHGHDAGRYQHSAIVDQFFAHHLLSER
jgi:cephalosporin-C deacetylase-like acetyl esterase